LSVVFEASFMTSDLTAPYVVSTIPGDGATGSSLSTPIQVFFSEDLDINSVALSLFKLYRIENNNDTSIVSLNLISTVSHIVTLSPDETLEYESNYRITVEENAVSDLSENSLTQSHISSFITELAPDLTPPSLIYESVTPVGDNIPLNTIVKIAFSEKLGNDESSLQTIISVYELNNSERGDDVNGYVTLEPNDSIIVFNPEHLLLPGQRYAINVITKEIYDIANNYMYSSNYGFSFTTLINQPVADAGEDIDATKGSTIQINGSSTDPNGQGITYHWEHDYGLTVIGDFTNVAQQTIQLPDIVGSTRILLVTTDGLGYSSDTDYVNIRIWADKNSDNQFVTPGESIQAAIDAAAASPNPGDVYVAQGLYLEVLELKSGVDVYGDYTFNAGGSEFNWFRDRRADPENDQEYDTYITNENRADNVIFDEAQSSWTVLVSQQSNIVFDQIVVVSVDRPLSLGEWSDYQFVPDCYGIIIEESSNITISDNFIATGNARPGAKGANGVKGYEGTDGSPGTPGQGGPGGDFGGVIGDEGGRGGDPVAGGSGQNGSESGSLKAQGGHGGVWGSWNPGVGENGPPLLYPSGATGDGGAGLSIGTEGFFLPSNGEAGEYKGKWGSGGGGGGAGAAIHGHWGGAGGGGASGGGPGNPGKGGWGGGASIGIIVQLLSQNIVIMNNVFITGNGGNGGDGGNGGRGGYGGDGGAGETGKYPDLTQNGAKGGNGSYGSSGGPGGGGSGGSILGILADGSVVGLSNLNNTHYPWGTPGERGWPGDPQSGGSVTPGVGERGISQLFYQVP
jgi:Big-like domain-containing protein